jgi:hypothetical protein
MKLADDHDFGCGACFWCWIYVEWRGKKTVGSVVGDGIGE